MCGIAGLIKKQGIVGEEEIGRMEHLLDRMKYRGPDNAGMWNDQQVLLGHRRLSIIDLSPSGNQPFHNVQNDLHIVFNGEIYNYREIKSDLIKMGHAFKTNTDTEVLLCCYMAYGLDFVKHLRGMFAFVLYDRSRSRAIFARDRMGKKPLFFYEDSHQLIFCSELKHFHAFRNIDLSINASSLANLFLLQYIPGPETIYRKVKSINPGELKVFDLETGRQTSIVYWSIEDQLQSQSKGLSLDELDHLLRESVRYRLIADVEVGVLLSGGIDSSLLSCYARELSDSHLRAFSVNFADKEFDESPYAKMVSDVLGIELVNIKGDQISSELFEQCIYHADQPIGDPAVIPTYMISKALSQYVKVVLSGEGADELFHGYHYYQLEKFFQRLGGDSVNQPLYKLLQLVPVSKIKGDIGNIVQRFKKVTDARSLIGVGRWTTVYDLEVIHDLLQHEGSEQLPQDFFSHLQEEFVRIKQGTNPYSASLAMDLLHWLPDDLLLKVDRMTMAHSVEARAPFLDQELVDVMLRLPSSEKANLYSSKKQLRQLLKKKLPPNIATIIAKRKKHGFEVPKARWLKEDLREAAEEHFSLSNLQKVGLLDPSLVHGHWNNFLNSKSAFSNDRGIWLTFCFLEWHKQHTSKFGYSA